MKPNVGERLRKALSRLRAFDGESSDSSAACWLRDNRYLALREGFAALHSLREQAECTQNVEPLCEKLIELCTESGTELDENIILSHAAVYCEENVLTECELWMLMTVLKACVVIEVAKAVPSGETGEGERYEEMLPRLFSMLRFLSSAELSSELCRLSRIEKLLMKDPSGIYGKMADESKAMYRTAVVKLAKRYGLSEEEAADRCVELSKRATDERKRHVGYYILTEPLGLREKKHGGILYALSLAVIPSALTYAVSLIISWWAVLLYLPIFEIVKQVSDRLALMWLSGSPLRKHSLPRMSPREALPESARTLCVISSLLTSPESARALAKRLEEYRIASGVGDNELSFAVLGDLKESSTQVTDGDREIYTALSSELERLNRKWSGGFAAVVRARVLDEKNDSYMPRERKRGAIEDIIGALSGENTLDGAFVVGSLPENAAYLITLDADTVPDIASLRAMIDYMRHPLNRPKVDSLKNTVTEGYGILQPRVELDIESISSRFSRIFGGNGGADPYGAASPELYQGLFGEGSFTGKGIIDIKAYSQVLSGRFPSDTILSHDLLEGSYMRTASVSECAVSDSFPSRAAAYFDREERWVRGDWQILPWLTGAVPDCGGKAVANPLNSVARWKIADNIRRSITPAALLISLLCAVCRVYTGVFLSAAVLPLAMPIIFTLADIVKNGTDRERFASNVMKPIIIYSWKFLLDITFLPYRAYVNVRAAVTAVYRMTVSRKNMLSWVTAAESSFEKGSLMSYYSRMWFLLLCAVGAELAAVALNAPAAVMFTVLWLTAPYAAYALSRDESGKRQLDDEDRAYLREHAVRMMRYFTDNINEENNYLPPDNVQMQPDVGVARRTSPTNIGMAMLSVACTSSMDIVPRETALSMLEHMTDTIETLPKWNGHLFNWYSTSDAHPMNPRTVSTVDSGNLAGCLIALRQWLLKLHSTRTDELAERIGNIYSSMNFRPLYDGQRNLLRLGFDAERMKMMDSFYDLMASEARLASYIAVAKGDVPEKHWRSLNRTLVSFDGYRGLVSWSGSMFEYLMPSLLLPCYPSSLFDETQRFVLYCQKHCKGTRHGIPYGVSESSFFAFDSEMNYRYKAHGIAPIALKRGMGRERVIAPYASYLALLTDPVGAVNNLRKYNDMDMTGKYGFYEAADLTVSRLPEGAEYMPVRSFMVHHLGMSVLSIVNTLEDNMVVRLFLSDVSMRSFTGMLKERIPVGAQILPIQHYRSTPTENTANTQISETSNGYDPLLPRSVMLSNGPYRLYTSDSGQNRSIYKNIMIARSENELFGAGGILFFARLGEKLISLTPSPFYDPRLEYSSGTDNVSFTVYMTSPQLSTSVTSFVFADDASEMRRVSVENRTAMDIELDIISYMEPSLAPERDFNAHPMFSKLFLEYKKENGSVVISRRPRGNDTVCSVGFTCDAEDVRYLTSRERALGRAGFYGLANADFTEDSADTDTCCASCVRVRLKAGESRTLSYAVSAAATAEAALTAARRALYGERSIASHRVISTAAILKMTREDISNAFDMYTDCVYITQSSQRAAAYKSANTMALDVLWRFGISGDMPIICASVSKDTSAEKVETLIKYHLFLFTNGAYADLVFLTNDGGEYTRPCNTVISDCLREWESEDLMDVRSGVHIVDSSSSTHEERRLIGAAAGLYIDMSLSGPAYKPYGRVKRQVVNYDKRIDTPVNTEYTIDDGRVSFTSPSPIAWSHVLANSHFGYLATDTGSGHMWFYNSRENKLNEWTNDVLSCDGPEDIRINVSGESISVFGGRVTYEPGSAVWERSFPGLSVKTTAYVHEHIAARVMIIEASGEKARSATISCFTSLMLGSDASSKKNIITGIEPETRAIYAKNTVNKLFAPYIFAFRSFPEYTRWTCDENSFRLGEYNSLNGAGLSPCIAAELPMLNDSGVYKAVLVCGCVDDIERMTLITDLCFPAAAYDGLSRVRAFWRDLCRMPKTGDSVIDAFVSDFAAYQVIACRLLGRTSMYQNGGAYGFRDQLQDVLGLITCKDNAVLKRLCRTQLLRCAARQFVEGDVQHWFHPHRTRNGKEAFKGVRTRISDDLLFLPYVTSEYVRITGDSDIMNIEIPYLSDEVLREGEHDRYGQPQITKHRETLYVHCKRAIDCALDRGTGAHGLMLFGGGDWNDGMNEVGIKGYGESVWLTWFTAMTLKAFVPLCRDSETAEKYRQKAELLIEAAYRAWDGSHFLRGYSDDGAKIGSENNAECRIDAISQAFAPFADPKPENEERKNMQRSALLSAYDMLLDKRHRLVRLFAPPLSETRAGYISSYPKGARENGGQYTHGAVWLAMGLERAGLHDEAVKVMRLIAPSNRDTRLYRAEPYYIAADVSMVEGLEGRAGWTMYTGAASWYLTACREIFGERESQCEDEKIIKNL